MGTVEPKVLNLRIRLCGNNGKADREDICRLVLLSDHGNNKAINDEKLNAYAKRLHDFCRANESTQLPEWSQLNDEEVRKLKEKVKRMIRPFDSDPEDTGIYLCDPAN